MKKVYLLAALLWGCTSHTLAQYKDLDVVKVADCQQSYEIEKLYIPDIEGYKTLKCDFHTHTIFSDGTVMPEERVWEGLRRGLDAIAITDHIEYRPHSNFINTDHNESFKRAQSIEKDANIIVIKGAEITRAKPLGHLNALFLEDANALDVENPLLAIDKALDQGAFILWNHPGWPNDTSTIYKIHQELIAKKKIHGVELVNGFEFYPMAFNYCKDYGLAYMGNTDIHGVYNHTYRTNQQWGPITIVFARERSAEGIKEGLFARRSIAKFGDMLIGSDENLTALVKACLPYEIRDVKDNEAIIEVSNKSTLNFYLQLDNKIIPVLGSAYTEFKIRLDDKIKFVNTYITDNSQLKINISDLKLWY